MSEYLPAFIPTCEAYGWTGGPEFRTRLVMYKNGRERRNADWQQPQFSFELPFQNITQAQYAPIFSMFLNRRGRWGVFLYRNRLNYSADNDLVAVAEAGQTEFQLGKWSIIEGVGFYHQVYALFVPDTDGSAIEADPTVTVDGAVTTAFTVDHERGLVVFDSPLAGGEVVRWSGQFAHWVRFDADTLPFSIDNATRDDGAGPYVVNGSVYLREMPAPEEVASSGS
ncbi:DUF2460 domain-containing protein [Marilutibacter spongiae]|uniref:DUF2460 domain-containing protein n=1 Tax=Marilutibacter spongiae TaxID=2025720 RepID=A0A7W3TLB5_9GAMM|nr:DUF2460 domain-containing protein [Lysobacter spongiae]MBB1060432.1 DUF2460 domain-containing protein [Lysobacter spongiae]